MKTIIKIFSILILFVSFNSCKDKYSEDFTANSPVYLSYEDLRNSVKIVGNRELENPGKIYFKDGYIFVNEEMKGVHIIDNKDPYNPKNTGFIEIPGNVDIAIKNNILFADSYVDLVAIDISDINQPKEVNRVQDVFPYLTPPPENPEYRQATVDKEKGVVIDWEIKKVHQEIEYKYYPHYFEGRSDILYSSSMDYAKLSSPANGTFGVGGSMARFGLYKNYLYAVDNSTLYTFDIKTPEEPKDIGKQGVGWDIETMFIYDDHMFLGTRSGMEIFSLEVPTAIQYVSNFWHVTSCDPVVISEGFAYITLRGGNACGSNTNRLDVVELSNDYKENKLISSYPLSSPYGLGVDTETLFVCDGEEGLKIYDIENKRNIDNNQIAHFDNIQAYDVIPANGFLFLIGDDGFYQYDYSNATDIREISFIPVKKQDSM